jgi:glycosyltransferase involved in cell wall biosynthesis
MKILLTNFHYGRGGGHDKYVLTIAKALAARHQIFVAAPPGSRLFEHVSTLQGVTTLPFEFPAKLKDAGRMIAAWRDLRSLLRREGFDVVHVNGSPDHRLLTFSLMRLKSPKPCIVLTKHNSIPIKRDFLTKIRATRATDHVIAVSDSTAEMVRNSVYAHCGLVVIKNGVDTDEFKPSNANDAGTARNALLGLSKASKFVIGTVTGFDWYKGTINMIAAVAALPSLLRGQVEIVVVGTEPKEEQWLAIDSLSMRSQLKVVGFVEDVKAYIQTFDIGFVTSYAVETVSFACREMMAMGKPVIVSRYSGLPENVDDGVNGWLVPPHDPASLSQTLTGIVAGRDRLAEMGAAARAKAVKEFSSALFVDSTEKLYRLSQSTQSEASSVAASPTDSRQSQ